ncbi:MAG: NAD(P)/FAD-dependent oxidoreductase [Solirubrobacterales bacterium]|nr:FAD-dependent oxidoreductase [Solirubrobacterales bacterium]
MTSETRFKVLIAGGGIAAVEGMLALYELAHRRIDLELIAPNDELTIPALAVAEPFGISAPAAIPLADVCRDVGASHRRERLRGVDAAARTVQTESGTEVSFDALLLAVGASAEPALPGSLTYRGTRDNSRIRRLVLEAADGKVGRIAFAVPTSIQWPLPIYELALLAASELEKRGAGTKLCLVTHESSPLSLFGRRASEGVNGLLEKSGVDLITSAHAAGVQATGLVLHDGRVQPADRVVASPRLRVDSIEGVPQGTDGFIGTDLAMRVEGTPHVYAAGDATWFPIKQGGIASQQADTAASAIASLLDPDIAVERFQPVLRGALFTGGVPRYLRAAVSRRSASSADSVTPLWWPPAKVAGRHLAPYLAKRGLGVSLEDLEPLHGEDHAATEQDQREALELALAAADADARWRDYRAALRWLDVAQELNLALPAEYAEKRRDWEAAAGRA